MGVFNQLLIERPWSDLNKADTWRWGLPSLFSECRPHFYMWSKAAWPDLFLFILASDLPFFPFNFLLASCAVCLSFLVPLLVLTRVLHSDPLFSPSPSSLTCLFLFRCSFLCPLHILRPLTRRHASLGRAPIPSLESLPWLPRWILVSGLYCVPVFK